jgi:adenylate cyclase
VKKYAVRIALGVAIVLVFVLHAGRIVDIPFIERLELIAYDARLRITMPGDTDKRVVIVDIDEKSLASEGRWPWRRDKIGTLLDQLFDYYRIAIVGFDVVFAEPDESSGIGILKDLSAKDLHDDAQFQTVFKQVQPRLEYDRIFASKLKDRPVILGYYFNEPGRDGAQTANALPSPVLPHGTFKGRNIQFRIGQGYGANLPELQSAAAGAGHFNPYTDEDGATRRVPMLYEYQGAYYEALSLAMVRLIQNFPKVVPGFPNENVWTKSYSGLEWIDAGAARIPVDEMVTTLVPYRGAQSSYPYVSATDVLARRTDPQVLKGAIVLVGTTAPGLNDLRSTPVGKVYPGVEVHANLITGMLDGKIKQKPPYVMGAEVVLLLLSGLVLAIALPLLNPQRASLLTAFALVAVFGLNVYIWNSANLVLPLASGLLMIALQFGANMSYGYFVESRAKREMQGRFGQYVPPELVDEMTQHPEAFSMEGKSREMTVLFTDARGFTTISEGLEPRELSKLMNEFLTPLTRVIHKHRGTIDKYMGDCIMAFWGAPLDDPEHAKHAVLAGLEMQATLRALHAEFQARGWPLLQIGVGVNTGRMNVGNMGSEIRVAYTVMGDAVNLASRLEGITKEYGLDMLVGEGTRAAIKDFIFREVDLVAPKGKEKPVAIYEPIGESGKVDRILLDELKLWGQALKHYRAQDWDMAELQLMNLSRMNPDRVLYKVFAQRIADYRTNPPPKDWDGAHRFKVK